MAERLAFMCVLPPLLSGILGARTSTEQLSEYLRKLLVQNTISDDSWSGYHITEVIDAICFLCTFEEHHAIVFNILWEMVVSSNADMKTEAANLLKVLVPYIDVKVASTQVLPALVTLGSDQNLNVKYASTEAFGAVAQHVKNDMIVEKMVQLTAVPSQGKDVVRRHEKANVFCEVVHALDATELPATSIHGLLLPAIQNLLRDPDALDPAHKEALEIILKERSGGAFDSISKVMGAHLGIATSVSSFFGESGLRGKKEIGEQSSEAVSSPPQPSLPGLQDSTRFQRIMRGGFGDTL